MQKSNFNSIPQAYNSIKVGLIIIELVKEQIRNHENKHYEMRFGDLDKDLAIVAMDYWADKRVDTINASSIPPGHELESAASVDFLSDILKKELP